MNRDDIIRMAREAGLFVETSDGWDVWMPDNLEDFANLVAAAEREFCAQIAFNSTTYIEAAKAIRARGQ